MSDDKDFRHESLQDCDTIVKYLNAITEGFKNGHIHLGNGGHSMDLEPSGLLKLDLKAKKKDNRIKLDLKIRWKEREASEEVDNKPLIIESKQD